MKTRKNIMNYYEMTIQKNIIILCTIASFLSLYMKWVFHHQYQMKSAREHILDKPDTYIGSIQNTDTNMWCFDQESGKIILRNIEYVPGLYKIFDEGIVNCRDHVIRTLSKESVLSGRRRRSFH
jgi:hypothetical protein